MTEKTRVRSLNQTRTSDLDAQIVRLRAQGMGIRAISRALSIADRKVNAALHDAGLGTIRLDLWPDELDDVIRDSLAAGLTYAEIGERINRTRTAVRKRAKALDISVSPEKANRPRPTAPKGTSPERDYVPLLLKHGGFPVAAVMDGATVWVWPARVAA